MSINEFESESDSLQYSYEKISDKEIWEDIIDERDKKYSEVQEYLNSKQIVDEVEPVQNPELKYLEEHIFPLLLPLMELMLKKAIKMECVKHQKSLFNGIDYLSELLWHKNTRYPERAENPKNIFLLPWVQEWLKEHPRPIFPKSWIWTKETACIIIQAYMRGHFVRIDPDVQEMRQFWKIMRQERIEREMKEQYESEQTEYEGTEQSETTIEINEHETI